MAASRSPLAALRLARSRVSGPCPGRLAAALGPPAPAPGSPLCKAYTIRTPASLSPPAAAKASPGALAACHGPLDHYDFLVRMQELKDDEQQRKVVQCLQKLHEDLRGYSREAEGLLSKNARCLQMSRGRVWKGETAPGLPSCVLQHRSSSK